MTELWQHQAEDFESSKDLPGAALHWEPRLGKTRVTIKTAQHLMARGRINAVIVIAPNGVHLNWTREELPKYWPTFDSTMVVEWSSARSDTKAAKQQLDAALTTEKFVWLTVNVEALGSSTKLVNLSGRGRPGYLERFVKMRRALLVCDESHFLKNHRAQRTRSVLKICRACPYRRNLTGTPDPQGPFDLFSQYKILDEGIFGRYITPFRERYGVFQRQQYGRGPAFMELVEYQNLDELAGKMAPITFTRRKKSCLDLPPRQMKGGSEVLGIPRFFVMDKKHRKVYDDVRDDMIAKLDCGEKVTATNALTNLLRLQQISRGFVGVDNDGGDVKTVDLGGPYPSIEATIALLSEHRGKAVVWCHFVPDVDLLAKQLDPDETLVCDGRVDPRDRVEMRREFNDPESRKRWWIGTTATGGIGVDLGGADLMIFYSHSYRLDHRLQALERNYGSTQRASSLAVVDIIAADAVDYGTLNSLERKEDLAANLRELLNK